MVLANLRARHAITLILPTIPGDILLLSLFEVIFRNICISYSIK